MLAQAEAYTPTDTVRRIGKIPIRNLWLLMLYASDLYRHLGTSKVDVEDNPEDIADLVAEILCHQVKQRLMRNLSYGYESKVAVISRVRGRIDVLTTERHRLLEKGKVCCRFDELTINTPRNRYVLAALEKLTKLSIKSELKHRCKGLILSLERLGVSKVKPVGYSGKSERFGHHDSNDQKMVFAADLTFALALPTESDGMFYLPMPDRKEQWIWELFEKAIAGFYAVRLDKKKWRVHAGKWLNWQRSASTAGMDELLPKMQTDIVIKHISGKYLVIDTKFNSIMTKGRQQKEKLDSKHIYQMYAYLRSQEKPDDINTQSSIGMLLHPTVDKDFTEWVIIQGHPIWFCTVNLGETASSIRERLLQLRDKTFDIDGY